MAAGLGGIRRVCGSEVEWWVCQQDTEDYIWSASALVEY